MFCPVAGKGESLKLKCQAALGFAPPVQRDSEESQLMKHKVNKKKFCKLQLIDQTHRHTHTHIYETTMIILIIFITPIFTSSFLYFLLTALLE